MHYRLPMRVVGVRSFILVAAFLSAALVLAPRAAAAAMTSNKVAYVSDFGTGANDPNFLGSSIFVNALTGSDPGPTYTTADGTKTVSLTDVPVSAIDSGGAAALAPYDTVIMYEVCDIGSHPATVSALNTFLQNGGKLMIFDADRCYGTMAPDYSAFLFSFTTSNPGPQGATGSYTTVVPSTLTTGLSVGPVPYDSIGDANIFTSFSGAWCASLTATNVLGANGFVQAYARTTAGGLVVYSGEDNWFTDGASLNGPHARTVFDNELKQNWAPDGLPCSLPASGISLSPPSQTLATGASATVTAKVVDINGNPIANVPVTFAISSGPNAGKTGSGTTDSTGQASFTYADAGGAGTDSLVASFVDSTGVKHSSNTATVTWSSPTVAPKIDDSCYASGGGSAKTIGLDTTQPNELVVAYVAADGPNSGGSQTISSVTGTEKGSPIVFTRVTQENGATGDVEVWTAKVATPGAINVTAKASKHYEVYLEDVSYKDATGIGQSGSNHGASGAPTVTLNGTQGNAWVWGVGFDWAHSAARTPGSGQTVFQQTLDTTNQNTFWVQSTTNPTAGGSVTINDLSPTTDPFDIAAVEIQ